LAAALAALISTVKRFVATHSPTACCGWCEYLGCTPIIVLFSQDESTSQRILTSSLGKNLAEPMEFAALNLYR
jgi:hypothetical protein